MIIPFIDAENDDDCASVRHRLFDELKSTINIGQWENVYKALNNIFELGFKKGYANGNSN